MLMYLVLFILNSFSCSMLDVPTLWCDETKSEATTVSYLACKYIIGLLFLYEINCSIETLKYSIERINIVQIL